jgi:predicted TIM-barrel fold metal-dependent hydrolase
MNIKYGLISCDSHVALSRNAFTNRMAKAKWGERVPQVVEVEDGGRSVHRWSVNGQVMGRTGARGGSICNCPALMNDALSKYPQRWEEIPAQAYVPRERLKALDLDRVDAEVLFPNDPGSFYQYEDAEFELACVRAYNDAVAEWREESDRYVPLAMIPFLSDMPTIVAEVERASKKGHSGLLMLAEPSVTIPGLKHIGDEFWSALWAVCEDLELPINIHASGGLGGKLGLPRWQGYAPNEYHAAFTIPCGALPAQQIANLIFSGVLYRHPRLKWVFAESGIGSINYIRQACDHEWERRRLWTEGLPLRPSEVIRRQIFVDFWFEKAGVEMRHEIGVDNIMWESDFPHVSSLYPESWRLVESTLEGISEAERRKMLWENAVNLYHLG